MNTFQTFDRCIIDVGCYRNGIRGKHLKKLSNLPVIFIDANIDALNDLIIQNNDLKICAALSNRSGVTKFNMYPHDETHSICETNLDNATEWIIDNRKSTVDEWTVKEVRFVPMLSLGDIVETLSIKSIAALKIDTQGHDLQVIFGLREYITLVEYIELEVQIVDKDLYINSSKKSEVIDYLTNWGFVLIKEKNQSCNQEQNLFFLNRKYINDK